MPLDPKLLSTYLAMIQAKKLRDAQAQPDATRVAPTTPPTKLTFNDTSLAVAAALSRMQQQKTQAATPQLPNPEPVNATLLNAAHPETMKKVIIAAKRQGVDPYTMLAIGLQETGLQKDRFNPFNTQNANYKDARQIPNPNYDPNMPETTPTNTDFYDVGARFFKDKLKYADSLGKKDEAHRIQAWNGYGKIGGANLPKNKNNVYGWSTKIYGIETKDSPINMNENPVYGKRIIDIRENLLKKNPDIIKLVNSIQ